MLKSAVVCILIFLLFHYAVKSITSGEGGFLTTNSKSLAKKFKILRSHGIKRTSNKKKYWNYDVIFPSFNFRMSDINVL